MPRRRDPGSSPPPPCFLCGAYAGLHMRVRPPTAGVGVLCIDGGGVRGIIPTTILELLEEEHFQLCAGVCAGALALSTLFLNGWTAAKCSKAFEAFATTVFRRGQLAGLPRHLPAVDCRQQRPLRQSAAGGDAQGHLRCHH
ncbi:hypothetical protein EDB80DRAFT_262801 [Ilyonectria destructans]|nr:hypothetical protein EDB80DRAFT_262801 [Ilyonectria destructans]